MGAQQDNATGKTFTGAQLIVYLLERQGITTVAGIPGGAALPLYDALSQSQSIRHILTRHEQGAGFIAPGMARANGQPAMIGTDAFQEVDTYGMSIPITKHNYLVRDIAQLPEIICDAFRLAMSGRPGPVWVDVPKDIQQATITLDQLPPIPQKDAAPAFNTDLVIQAAQMINQAKNPVLYLGGGIISSEACKEAIELAEKNSLPTTMTLMGLGLMPPTHPL